MTRHAWIVGLATVLLVGCGRTPMKDPRQETSFSFAYATWKEERGAVTVLIDSLPASFRDDQEYIPLPIAIGNQDYGGTVSVSPEIFTLIDQTGTAYGAAAYEELLGAYPKLEADVPLTEDRPAVSQQFELSRRLPSSFYPAAQQPVIRSVHLDAFTWLQDTLYFPRPASGLGGVMTLKLEGGGIDPPIEVRFKVPLEGVKIR